MIVIYDTLGSYGGSHTLMLRMSEWISSQDIKMTIIGTSISNTEIVEKLRNYNVKIIEADLSEIKNGYQIIKSLLDIERIKVYCFAWNHYLDVECIKNRYNLSFDNFVYCIHPETFKKGIGFKAKFLRNYSITSYRKIFERMNNNGSLISLDVVNIRESEKYLHCNLGGTTPIIALPMYCQDREDREAIIEKGFKSNILLTAARADFPYKGYMVGLIDIFAKQKKIHPEMVLEIVASGDDIQQLKDKIEEQDQEIKMAIFLRGWMDYEELKAKMGESKVFIGMGTTVFDAALQYKPSIVVKFSTMKCISDHFVTENPTYMTTVSPECEESAESRIDVAFAWDFDEYYRQSIDSFNRTKEVYEINKCMKRMVYAETINKGSLLTKKESVVHSMNQKFNKIRFRNKKASDFKNLEWESTQEN